MGLMNLRDVFKKTIDLQLKEQLYVLDGVVFGSDDFCADIGHSAKDSFFFLHKCLVTTINYDFYIIVKTSKKKF